MKKTAQKLQSHGRRGDTLLAHINPQEADLLKMFGGRGSRNPKTGLLEFDTGGGDSGPGYSSGDGYGGGYGADGYSGDTGGYAGQPSGSDSWGSSSGGGGGSGYSTAGADFGFGNTNPYASVSNNGMISTESVADSVYGPGFSSGEPGNYSPELSLENMMGYGNMVGAAPADAMASYSGESNWAAGAEDSTFSKVMKNPFAKFALATLAKSNPALATAMKAYSMYNMASNVGQGKGTGQAVGTIGSIAGGALGGEAAGPLGAVAGSYFGGKGLANAVAGSSPGGDSAGTGPSPGKGGGSFSQDALGALGSMYAGNMANKSATKQINQLQGLYSPDSPYAQMARQRMERRDAASGRRSQYGVRETELAALLADRAAQQAPTLQSLYNQKDVNRANMIGTGLAYYDRLGGYDGIKKGIGDAYDAISGWF